MSDVVWIALAVGAIGVVLWWGANQIDEMVERHRAAVSQRQLARKLYELRRSHRGWE